jgi:hypothetical protein
MMVGTARSPAVCRASPCRPCLPSALRCSSRDYSGSHAFGLSRLRLRDGRRSRSRRSATSWRSKHLPSDNGEVRVCCDQGRRQDSSLKGAEHGYSPLGGPTKLFSLNLLSKLTLNQNFLLLIHSIGGARAPAGPP